MKFILGSRVRGTFKTDDESVVLSGFVYEVAVSDNTLLGMPTGNHTAHLEIECAVGGVFPERAGQPLELQPEIGDVVEHRDDLAEVTAIRKNGDDCTGVMLRMLRTPMSIPPKLRAVKIDACVPVARVGRDLRGWRYRA